MRIAIGCDHRGLSLKGAIMEFLRQRGEEYADFGCYDTSSVDYPDIAREVAKAVVMGEFDHGILICSTGIGMSIAANKVKGIRAALCHDTSTAHRARAHNDANILCLGEMERDLGLNIAKTYLTSKFEGGRHEQRLKKIKDLEETR